MTEDGVITRHRELGFEGSFPSESRLTVDTVYYDGDTRHREYTNPATSSFSSFTGKQVTVSENHAGFGRKSRRQSGKFSGDSGGDFFTQKTYALPFDGRVKFSTTMVEPGWATTKCYFDGLLLPWAELARDDGYWFPPSHEPNPSDMIGWGTSAIASCKPTQSPANLATALIELRREGLPKLVGASAWKSRAESLRKAPGDELLNWEFGIKPLANDIADVATVISQHDTLIEQYLRDVGKIVRRRFVFPPDIHRSEEVVARDVSPALIGPSHSAIYDWDTANRGKVTRERIVSRSCWFSGAFTYHLPIDPITMKQEFKRNSTMRDLLGANLTPETIWNLTPWSWAADWFYNAGDVISNLQSMAGDLLVMRYGYIMCHTMVQDTYTFSGPTGIRSDVRPPVVVFVNETKQRMKASPFGFGKTWGSLSARQLAIAAALGINRT